MMKRWALAAPWVIAGVATAWGGEATGRDRDTFAASAVLLGLGDRKGQLLYRSAR